MKSKNKVLLKKLYQLLQDIIDLKETSQTKHKWLIYGRDSCPVCKKTINYMKKEDGFEYREISQVNQEEMNNIYKIVGKHKRKITVPIIFKLNNSKYKYVGGFSDI